MAKGMKVFDVATGSSRTARDLVLVSGGGVTLADTNTVQTFTNKTLTAPTLTAVAITGTSTIGAGMTITSPAISNATLTTPTHTLGVQVLAGAGTTIADAAAINAASGSLVHATGGNNSVGIKLPAGAAGMYYIVNNDEAANGILKVYPQVNSQVNAIAANGSISMTAKTKAHFVAINATNWVTVPLLPS